ncbi:MAG: hypothetical protein JXB29_04260 [Sedimentisphaerales bacterium]|nr:hypothetical protein [Sedimentisphaerales bacterium]
MASFSNDTDILKYEPILFGELHLPNQVLAKGTGGTLSGTTFTASGADFVSVSVAAGGAIYLHSADGSLDGGYEIVSVDSATELTVSVVRADSDNDAVSPPSASSVSYRVSSFTPQAEEIVFQLTEYFGIKPGHAASDYDIDDILDVNVLKRASVFGVISSVYTMLASQADDENFWKKSLHYQRLFEKARERCRLADDKENIYIYLDSAGSLVTNEYSSFPDMVTTPHIRLAVVTTSDGDIDLITDARIGHNFVMPYESGGVKKTVEAHTSDDTLTVAESGSIHTNLGAGGTVTLTLPASASAGTVFTFAVQAAYGLRVDPGSATIRDDSGQTADKYKVADAIGECLAVAADSNGDWVTIAKNGTWTEEA